MTPIIIGENVIIRRSLLDYLGSPLPLANLTSISVDLVDQDKNIIQSYVYPSTDLRDGTASNELELEITSAVSGGFQKGNIYLKYRFEQNDSVYTDEGILIDLVSELILEVSE